MPLRKALSKFDIKQKIQSVVTQKVESTVEWKIELFGELSYMGETANPQIYKHAVGDWKILAQKGQLRHDSCLNTMENFKEIFLALLSLCAIVFIFTVNTNDDTSEPTKLEDMNQQSTFLPAELSNSAISLPISDRLKNCECKSLFTIGSCDAQVNPSSSVPQSLWERIVDEVHNIDNGGDYLINSILHSALKYMPPYFLNQSDHMSLDDIMMSLHNVINKFPSNKCDTHLYQKSDILQCLDDFHEDTGEKLHLYFMGDSLSRSILEQIITDLKSEFPPDFFTLNGKDLEPEIFFNIQLTMSKVVYGKNIVLRFFWGPYLDRVRNENDIQVQGAKDVLSFWVNGSKNHDYGPIPHLLYISNGLWDSMRTSSVTAVTDSLNTWNILSPLIEKLGTQTTMLVHQYSLMKPYLKAEAASSTVDFVDQTLRLKIRNLPAVIWDTIALLFGKERDECIKLFRKGAKNVPKSWGCDLYNHPGTISRQITANMMWNLICNKYRQQNNLCCA